MLWLCLDESDVHCVGGPVHVTPTPSPLPLPLSWTGSESPLPLVPCATCCGLTHWRTLGLRSLHRKTTATTKSGDVPTIIGGCVQHIHMLSFSKPNGTCVCTFKMWYLKFSTSQSMHIVVTAPSFLSSLLSPLPSPPPPLPTLQLQCLL